jgi:hypothetical protein
MAIVADPETAAAKIAAPDTNLNILIALSLLLASRPFIGAIPECRTVVRIPRMLG